MLWRAREVAMDKITFLRVWEFRIDDLSKFSQTYFNPYYMQFSARNVLKFSMTIRAKPSKFRLVPLESLIRAAGC
jgi:hypothetical protein